MGLGTLVIKSHNMTNFQNFEFGISQKNGTVPMIWGGDSVTLANGKKAQIFRNLEEGRYKWFVRIKGTNNIVSQGVTQVKSNETKTECCENFTKELLNVQAVRIEANEHKMKKVRGVACYDSSNNYTFVTPTIPINSSFVEIEFLSPFTGRVEFF